MQFLYFRYSVIYFRNIMDFKLEKFISVYQFIQYFSASYQVIHIFTIQTADTLQIRRQVGSTLQLRYQVRTTIRWFVWSVAPSKRHIYSVNLVGRYPPDRVQIEYLISYIFQLFISPVTGFIFHRMHRVFSMKLIGKA